MSQILVVFAALSLLQGAPAESQAPTIDFERSIEAIRRFRRDALSDSKDPVDLNFCAVKEAYDADGVLRQPRRYQSAPLSRLAECTPECAASGRQVVCFEKPRVENGSIIFPAFRRTPGGAKVGELYTISPGPNPAFYHVKQYTITGVTIN